MAEEEVVAAAVAAAVAAPTYDHKRKLDEALDEQPAVDPLSENADSPAIVDTDVKRPRIDPKPDISQSLSVNGNGYPEEEGTDGALEKAEEVTDEALKDAEGVTNVASIDAEGVTNVASIDAEGGTDAASKDAEGGTDAASKDAEGGTDAASKDAEGGTDVASKDAEGVTDVASKDAEGVTDVASNDEEGVTDAASNDAEGGTDAASKDADGGTDAASKDAEEAPADHGCAFAQALKVSPGGGISDAPIDEVEALSAEEHRPSSAEEQQQPSAEDPLPSLQPSDDPLAQSRRIQVPNNKVGVLIGKAGDTIRYLQYNSGAKIQILRDAHADLSSPMRPVELIGSLDSIDRAEKLIKEVIAEAEAGGSPSLVARGIATAQVSGIAEQIEIKVPNEKVGLIIGKGGDTIKGLQARSGARIQLIPQHLPEGDESKERIVRVSGDKREVDIAIDMIRDAMKQLPRASPLSGGHGQPIHRFRGPGGPPHWGSRAPYPSQAMGYDYQPRGPYASQNSPYPPPLYSGYPHSQMAPRGDFGPGWEYRQQTMQRPPHHGGGYDYYSSGQGNTLHSGPQSLGSSIGQPQSQAGHNYGQPHGPEYGHQVPYNQAAGPQQNYGHGYNEPLTQHPPYGVGHTAPQLTYPQTAQSGYVQPGKLPGYGMPPQPYNTPQASQPGDLSYQQPAPAYGPPNTQQQQTYPYPSSGPMLQTYPIPMYGSTTAYDGINQCGNVYAQQGQQPASGYIQQPNYGQTGPYPTTQQSYPEQPAVSSTAGYGHQAPQDAQFYGAAGGQPQPVYAQQPTNQPAYDQSATQSGNYGNVAVSAPANHGSTVSPQPGAYPQYDSSTQVPGTR